MSSPINTHYPHANTPAQTPYTNPSTQPANTANTLSLAGVSNQNAQPQTHTTQNVQLYGAQSASNADTSWLENLDTSIMDEATANVYDLMKTIANISNEIREQSTEIKWAQLDAYEAEMQDYVNKLKDAATTALTTAVVTASISIAMTAANAISSVKSMTSAANGLQAQNNANAALTQAENMNLASARSQMGSTSTTASTQPSNQAPAASAAPVNSVPSAESNIEISVDSASKPAQNATTIELEVDNNQASNNTATNADTEQNIDSMETELQLRQQARVYSAEAASHNHQASIYDTRAKNNAQVIQAFSQIGSATGDYVQKQQQADAEKIKVDAEVERTFMTEFSQVAATAQENVKSMISAMQQMVSTETQVHNHLANRL